VDIQETALVSNHHVLSEWGIARRPLKKDKVVYTAAPRIRVVLSYFDELKEMFPVGVSEK
jgi:hypothetical protein